jgi:hypothetical protein
MGQGLKEMADQKMVGSSLLTGTAIGQHKACGGGVKLCTAKDTRFQHGQQEENGRSML